MTGPTTARCPRLFEVEAVRDGRLSGTELARFRTHLTLCADCAREARSLDALGDALREGATSGDSDELRVRRERTRLLAAFDATLVPTLPRPFAKRWRFAAAACAALGALAVVLVFAFGLGKTRPKTPAASATRVPVLPAREPVTVDADRRARFTRQTEANVERIILESGALSIHVERARSPRRLLLVLPDGELEDIGTTFSVSADGGHTTRVTVQEGSVVLRLRGSPTIVLAAGDAWTRAAPPDAPGSNASPLPAPSLRAGKTAPGVQAPKAAVDNSAGFRVAMAEFNAGNYAEAAQLFGTFITSHPGDARAEDAAYLRVLALQHGGNAGATRQAARDYLGRYPAGFRHAEVESLSH